MSIQLLSLLYCLELAGWLSSPTRPHPKSHVCVYVLCPAAQVTCTYRSLCHHTSFGKDRCNLQVSVRMSPAGKLSLSSQITPDPTLTTATMIYFTQLSVPAHTAGPVMGATSVCSSCYPEHLHYGAGHGVGVGQVNVQHSFNINNINIV